MPGLFEQKAKRFYERMLYGADFPFTPASNRKKFIFIHVPKSAGSAVREALGEPEVGRKHLPWWVYYNANINKYRNYYKFSFVRDPYDRICSAYAYLRGGGNGRDDLCVAKRINEYGLFGDFVAKEICEGEMQLHPLFRPQVEYLYDWKEELMVDYVGRFENIDHDFKVVQSAIGLPDRKLKMVNKGGARPNKKDPGIHKLIHEKYERDYRLLSYD